MSVFFGSNIRVLADLCTHILNNNFLLVLLVFYQKLNLQFIISYRGIYCYTACKSRSQELYQNYQILFGSKFYYHILVHNLL